MGFSFTYVVEAEFFAENLTGKILPMSIVRGNKVCDYFTENLPYQTFQMHFTLKDALLIKDMRKSLKAKLTIKRRRYLVESKKDDKTPISDKKKDTFVEEVIIMDDIFVPIFNDEDFPTKISEDDVNADHSTQDAKGMVSGGMSTVLPLLTVGFFHKGMKATMKKMSNFVSTSSMATILGFLADQAEVESIILDTPDNSQSYKEVILPSSNWINSLNRLQITYGFYKTGMTIFHDLGVLYILDKYASEHDYLKGDSPKVIFEVIDMGTTLATAQSVIDKEGDVPKYSFGAAINDLDDSALRGELVGNSVLFSNMTLAATNLAFDANEQSKGQGTGGIVIDGFIDPHSETGKAIIVEWDEINSPYGLITLMREMAGGNDLHFRLESCDITSFLPNKTIDLRIIGDEKKNQKLRAGYGLKHVQIDFAKINPSDDEMVASAIISIFRTVKNAG